MISRKNLKPIFFEMFLLSDKPIDPKLIFNQYKTEIKPLFKNIFDGFVERSLYFLSLDPLDSFYLGIIRGTRGNSSQLTYLLAWLVEDYPSPVVNLEYFNSGKLEISSSNVIVSILIRSINSN